MIKIKRFEFNMFPVNCYVIWDDTNEAVIIDPGCFYDEEKEKLKEFIETKQLTIKHILNTHLHLDHIFGNNFVSSYYKLPVQAHKADEFWISEAPKQSRMFGFHLKEEPKPIDKYISEGDIIDFGNTKFMVIHVPGHSPGSIVFYSVENKCAFSGDVLFQGSIGRADLKGGNFEELIENIKNKLFVLPDDVEIYPGHGNSTTIGTEKRNNPFFRL